VAFEIGGTGNLPERGGVYDAVVLGLALNFFPDPKAAIQEQLSLLRPDGIVGAFVWDYEEEMGFLRHFWDFATKIDPGAVEIDEGLRVGPGPWKGP
jgi:SAM-dependent methyltransferase